jgi:trans-2,3-dihydro-3-hydroxyanthranilate isomerase
MHSSNPQALAGNPQVELVSVFAAGPGGGNPAPIVLDARGLDAAQMRAIAAHYGHESAFVLPPEDGANAFRLRFFVPNHEMEMCGHATVGALWLLKHKGLWSGAPARIETVSGIVQGQYQPTVATAPHIEISQPAGHIAVVTDAALLAQLRAVLRIDADAQLAWPVLNACTSRVKTLIRLASPQRLHALQPDYAGVEAVCAALGSTGLYPFAVEDAAHGVFQARQFPRASGYPEDAATGIAAAALLYGLQYYGLAAAHSAPMTVRQGVAMGRPSAIAVRFAAPAPGGAPAAAPPCWLGGAVHLVDMPTP